MPSSQFLAIVNQVANVKESEKEWFHILVCKMQEFQCIEHGIIIFEEFSFFLR